MCETCGCGEQPMFHEHEDRTKKVDLEASVLSKNARLAERNRGIFEAMEVLVLIWSALPEQEKPQCWSGQSEH